MLFKIYQLKNIRKTDYAFRDWECASSHGFDIKDYKLVYSGDREKNNILENLFVEFNLNHPEDFRGHSMSVSDVVAIKEDSNDYYWYYYYCDDFGWEEITYIVKEMKEKEMEEKIVCG